MLTQACDSHTGEAEVGGSGVQYQLGLHSKNPPQTDKKLFEFRLILHRIASQAVYLCEPQLPLLTIRLLLNPPFLGRRE